MLEIQRIVEQFTVSVGDNLVQLLAAFGVLVFGWLIALIISAVFRGALKRLKINERLVKRAVEDDKQKSFDLERESRKASSMC